LFATHYHELTELEGKLSGVNNYCIAVKEQGEDIVFLRKIIKGGADKSYGIQVAKLAGVPDAVLSRAREIVDELSNNDITYKVKQMSDSLLDKECQVASIHENNLNSYEASGKEKIIQQVGIQKENLQSVEANDSKKTLMNKKSKNEVDGQISFFTVDSTNQVIEEIRNLDVANMTPMDAMNMLYQLQKQIKG